MAHSAVFGIGRMSEIPDLSGKSIQVNLDLKEDEKYAQAATYLMGTPRQGHGRQDKSLAYHAVTLPSDEEKSPKPSADEFTLLGLPIFKWSPPAQLFFCIFGVFFFYLFYGYMQELIFRLDGFKPFGWYLTLVQFACYTIFGILDMRLKGNSQRKIPLKTYSFLAFLTVSTMGLSNASVGYLNYPTQVVFKCCKLIPVMIGGYLINRKRYGPLMILAALCMSVGLVLFTLADSTVQPNFDPRGVVMISLALCADAVLGNVQEKSMKNFQASNTEVILFSYGIGFWYIFAGLVLSGQIIPAFWFFSEHPMETYAYATVFSLSGYIGISFVLTLIRLFGALLAVTVTTGRKAISIVISFLFFSKPFTMQYVWFGLIVLLGIFLNVYSKNRQKIDGCFSDVARRFVICLQNRGRQQKRDTYDV